MPSVAIEVSNFSNKIKEFVCGESSSRIKNNLKSQKNEAITVIDFDKSQ